MNRDYFAIMAKDLKNFSKKGAKTSPTVAWIGSNSLTRMDMWKAAKAHNMSMAEFQDYMEQFRNFYQ